MPSPRRPLAVSAAATLALAALAPSAAAEVRFELLLPDQGQFAPFDPSEQSSAKLGVLVDTGTEPILAADWFGHVLHFGHSSQPLDRRCTPTACSWRRRACARTSSTSACEPAGFAPTGLLGACPRIRGPRGAEIRVQVEERRAPRG